jgi:hypothetical protein
MAPWLRDYVMTDTLKSQVRVIMTDVIAPEQIAQCSRCKHSEQGLLNCANCRDFADGV